MKRTMKITAGDDYLRCEAILTVESKLGGYQREEITKKIENIAERIVQDFSNVANVAIYKVRVK